MVGESELKVPPSGICPPFQWPAPSRPLHKGGKRSKHDHGSEGAFIPGGVRHIWTHVRELNTKEIKSHDRTHAPTPETGGSLQSSGHIIPGECPRWCWNGGSLLGEIPNAPSPTAETPGPSSSAPPTDAGHLQEETNEALGELLATKSTIDTHWQKLVWELGIAHCQNKSWNSRIHKGSQGCLWNNHYGSQGHLCLLLLEAKTLCSLAIRDAETQGASQAGSLQLLHAKSIQCLEEQVWGREQEWAQLPLCLSNCPMSQPCRTLQHAGSFLPGIDGTGATSLPFSLSQEASPSRQVPAPWILLLLHLNIHLDPSDSIPLQTQWMFPFLVGPHPRHPRRAP